MSNPVPPVEPSLDQEDVLAVASALSSDELSRLKQTEELIELRRRRKRKSHFSALSSAVVGYVALAGFFANAYQSCANKQSQERHDTIEAERWSKEFERSRRSDQYHAFFETSVLATDPSNPDKRLVGYALLQEFVNDPDYNSKATVMLEESLIRELRDDTAKVGLMDSTRNAVIAILSSLSQTSDCRALERAVRSIDKIAKHHTQTQDVEETGEVFRGFIRRILGRAAMVCGSMKELRTVRQPLVQTALRIPEIARLPAHADLARSRLQVTDILISECQDETSVSGTSDCPTMFEKYAKLCTQMDDKQIAAEEKPSCERVRAAIAAMGIAQAAANAGTSIAPDAGVE